MARRKTAEPTPEVEPVETPTEVVSDEDIRQRLLEEFQQRQQRQAPRTTLRENFEAAVALVAAATGKNYRAGIPRVSEQTAVKLLELTMGWHLSTRGSSESNAFLPDEEGNEANVGEPDIPTEIITGSPEPETQE